MKKLRVPAILISILLAAVSLSGCHGSKGLPDLSVPEEFDDSRAYEITFWAKNDTNKTQTAVYKKAIADFEKLYPKSRQPLKQDKDRPVPPQSFPSEDRCKIPR